MFWKLSLLVVAMGLTACVLLAVRMLRVQAAHELAAARLRIIDADARLCLLRARIAEHVSPERIAQATSGLGPLRPIPAEPDLAPASVPTASPEETPDAGPGREPPPTALADGGPVERSP